MPTTREPPLVILILRVILNTNIICSRCTTSPACLFMICHKRLFIILHYSKEEEKTIFSTHTHLEETHHHLIPYLVRLDVVSACDVEEVFGYLLRMHCCVFIAEDVKAKFSKVLQPVVYIACVVLMVPCQISTIFWSLVHKMWPKLYNVKFH